MTDKLIDRETYRKIKKMSREELQGFLMRYAENLTKDSPSIDLQEIEQDIKAIKGISEKRAEEVMTVIEKHLGGVTILKRVIVKSVHGALLPIWHG